VPYLLTGVLLVAVSALAFTLISARLGGRQPVLVLARAVPAGQVLASGDLRTVEVAAGADAGLVPVTARRQVTGRPAALPLAAGTLLTAADLGPAAFPPPGRAVAAVPVKPGQFPPALAAGDRVAVLPVPAAGSTPGASSGQPASPAAPVTATVTSVSAPAADGTAVVSLLLAQASALQVSAMTPGQASLVLLAPGTGGPGGGP